MGKKELKESFFQESAQVFKLLSSPIRLKLLNYISFCPRTVEGCADRFNQSIQNTSLHLIALAKAGILSVEKHKNFRIYSLQEKNVLDLISSQLIAGSRTLLKDDLYWKESLDNLARVIRTQKVSLIDLREEAEISYIPVTNAIPFHDNPSKLKTFLQDFDSHRPLVFFCRGTWCERMTSSVEAANRLRYNAKGAGLSALQLEKLNFQLAN
tara:strand:+ start:1110 stop:1742 length:633 start_codon:yes stop_codon:yes gene_type:complete